MLAIPMAEMRSWLDAADAMSAFIGLCADGRDRSGVPWRPGCGSLDEAGRHQDVAGRAVSPLDAGQERAHRFRADIETVRKAATGVLS
jgi:hypothetical protein